MILQTKEQLAAYFDHTLLDCMATKPDVCRHSREAVDYGFYAVCVQPRWVALCADILHGTGVKVVSVAGFPYGTNLSKVKAYEAEAVIMAGADEVDIVADLASVIAGDADYLRRDFEAVVKVCRSMSPKVLLKVIIESAALNEQQIQFVCGVAQDCGVDFLKTSTGFHNAGGADVEDVKKMAAAVPQCKIKAAGGIKTLRQALSFIEAGVSRIGASASVQIVEQFDSM
ncbi:MAG: deoxyribose-phosphate aldolase [Planctomycetales bacterium 4572_13]|nr:MAG: deoxyribose-phosphate aldolase [Planctomycetales bacterium 4572_13]